MIGRFWERVIRNPSVNKDRLIVSYINKIMELESDKERLEKELEAIEYEAIAVADSQILFTTEDSGRIFNLKHCLRIEVQKDAVAPNYRGTVIGRLIVVDTAGRAYPITSRGEVNSCVVALEMIYERWSSGENISIPEILLEIRKKSIARNEEE